MRDFSVAQARGMALGAAILLEETGSASHYKDATTGTLRASDYGMASGIIDVEAYPGSEQWPLRMFYYPEGGGKDHAAAELLLSGDTIKVVVDSPSGLTSDAYAAFEAVMAAAGDRGGV